MSSILERFNRLSVQKRLKYSFTVMLILIVVQGCVSLLFIRSIGNTGLTIGHELTPLTDAAMEIKLSATTAHLLFEEIMAGDEGESIDEVWSLIEESRWFAMAILEGGENEDGVFYPSQSQAVRTTMREVVSQIDLFYDTARKRYQQRNLSSGVGTESDEEFDTLYESLTARANSWKEIATSSNNIRVVAEVGNYLFYLANGHLLTEEVLSGDAAEDFSAALDNFNRAKAAAGVLVANGYTTANEAITDIDALKALAEDRYQVSQSNAGAGSKADEEFDAAFERFVTESEEAENYIHEEIIQALESQDRGTTLSLLIMLVCIISGIGLAIWLTVLSRNTIALPLLKVVGQVSELARGQRNIADGMWGTDRSDEIGDTARAADAFRVSIIKQQEQERTAAEERRAYELRLAEEEAKRKRESELAEQQRRETEAKRERQEIEAKVQHERQEMEAKAERERIERHNAEQMRQQQEAAQKEKELARQREEAARILAEEQLANQVKELANAARNGELQARIERTADDGARALMEASLNDMMENLENIIGSFSTCFMSLAQGNLTERLNVPYTGVFEHLRQDYNQSVHSLSELMGKIRIAAESVATSSGEIQRGNSDLNSRVDTQAAAVEELVGSLKGLRDLATTSKDEAQQTLAISSSASGVAQRGSKILVSTIEAMENISSSSRKIDEIIAVIDEIAFQTNLLALNAAVEAARAGEQGRGFAVVAGEVRNLAQRSAASANQIKQLIQDSGDKVDTGSKLVKETATVLRELSDMVEKTQQRMTSITEVTDAQSASLSEIETSIQQIDEFTQQNAALVEQATAASQSLNDESGNLFQLVGGFKVK